MNNVEYPVIPVSSEQKAQELVLDYLKYPWSAPLHLEDFPAHIDMKEYAPFFQRLYETTQDVFVYPNRPEELDRLKEITNNEDREASDPVVEAMEAMYAKQAPAERSSIAYLDVNDQFALKQSSITHGTFSQVPMEFISVMDEGNIPVLDMHTHPDDAFFSVQDFYLLLADLFRDSNTHATRGSVVLCPNMQILAIPSAETPLVDPNKLDELFKDSELKDHERQRLDTLLNRLSTITDIKEKWLYSAFQSYDDYISNLKIELGSDSEDFDVMIEDWLERFRKEGEEYNARVNRIYSKVNLEFAAKSVRALNGNAVAFARAMGLKLYISPDCRDFGVFTA